MAQYTPNTWTTGDVVTKTKLDRLEAGAAAALPTADAPELIRDTIGTALVAGANTTVTVNDAGDTITIASSGSGGSSLPSTIVNRTTAYTAAVGEFVLCNATSAGFTVTLPTSPATGALVAVKKTDGTANVVTIVAAGGGLIDGDANATVTSRNFGAVLEHVGSNAWQVTAVTSSGGSNGTNGTNGVGVPVGGTTGQVLAKTSNTDYATGWTTVSGGATDATTTAKGIVQLAGDLAGTAASPTVPGLTGKLSAASNLSDVASATTARTNLGLGTAATVNTGTASGNVPLLSTGGVLPVARLATGTPDGTKFVRDDGTLAVPAGGGGSLSVQDENGTAITGVTQLDFQGAGVTATAGTGEVIVTIPAGSGSGGVAHGFPTTLVTAGANTATNTLNGRISASRIFGSGTITKVRMSIAVASGNICVGIYAAGTATGGALGGQPGARKGTTGTIACPTAGNVVDIPLTGSVTVNDGDWFAIMADNNVASFQCVGNGSSLGIFTGLAGFTATGGSTLPLPTSLTLDNWESKVFGMVGLV